MAQTNESQEQVTINVETLQPVTRTLMTIGALPTSYLISMTYEEQLLWLQNYLIKTVIPAINNNAEATKEVQDIVMALQDYINTQFSELNLQEYIDNKLDEMLESGVFENILTNYVQLTKVYDTYNDMIIDASTFTNGMKLKTLGYHFINDGGGAEYIVTNVQNTNKYQVSIGTNLWIEMITDGLVNIKKLGAYGDGINDDTTIFKNAISKSNIYIPNGKYLITDTLFIPSNRKIIGEKNNTFFNGYNYGATLVFEATDTTIPCISFLGKRDGVNRKDVYRITGDSLDSGTYETTISSELSYVNIISNNNHNVGVVFSGCPTSTLQVSCYGFIFGIITSSAWGSIIKNTFVMGIYGIDIDLDSNDVKLSHIYCNGVNKNYIVEQANNLIYSIVTDTNISEPHRNKPSGILTRFVNHSSLEDIICEHFAIGFNYGSNSILDCNSIYGEDNNLFMATYTGQININGAFMLAPSNLENISEAISFNLTKLQINNAKSTYPLLIKEVNLPYQRYGNYYILSNIVENNTIIETFNSENPNILYIDQINGNSNGTGLKDSPIKEIQDALKIAKDKTELFLLEDYILPTNYTITIDKDIKIRSDKDNHKTIKNLNTINTIYPIRYLSNLAFEDINLTVLTNSQPSDPTYSSLLNPRTSTFKQLKLKNCVVSTAEYNALLATDYNNNSYTDLIIENCQFIGWCKMTRNHGSGSDKKIYIKQYISNTTFENEANYGTETERIETYVD